MNLCPDIDELLMELVYRWSCVNVAVGWVGDPGCSRLLAAARGCVNLSRCLLVFTPLLPRSLLFFSSCSGVDPELYELTTAKLDPGSSGSRVADAFARLMSTMEKTSTSTRWVVR